jgi:hypothetical protein
VDQGVAATSWGSMRASSRVPVLMHPGVHRHPETTPPPGTRVITPEDLDTLKEAVRVFAVDISGDQGWTRPETVTSVLVKHKLIGNEIIQHYSRTPAPTRPKV